MKNRSRLTALLLALVMLLSMTPAAALADVIQTVEDYQNAVQSVKDELSKPSVPQEEENSFALTRTVQEESIVRSANAGTLEQEGSYALPLAGRLTLTAPAAEGYQWQIRVGDVWANIVGDNGPSITLTYAKVQNALAAGGAQVRCVLVNGSQLTTSPVATVTVDSTIATETKSVEQTIPVTSFYVPAKKNLVQELNADVLADGDTDTPATYTIIINYVFADGTQAANPWTATVATGSTYEQVIQSPVVVGYAPDQTEVHVNASAAKTYIVTYKPAKVEFTVKHYQQNVANDDYTLVDTETKNGFTENAVGEGLAKTDYTGFYSLLYDTTTTIAADGSTVVEVYYDRYYYLMNFDLDGGYGVEPIYARYGAPVSIGKPTKPGYTFTGWDKQIPATMPAENTKYTANWEADGTAKVTIVVWGENADDENYSYYKNDEIMAKPGEKLTLDRLQREPICGKEAHSHTSSCIDCKHVHDLNCYTTNGSFVEVNKPSQTLTDRGNGIYSYTTGKVFRQIHYYLNIGDQWYRSSRTDTNRISFNCTHTHTDSCYICGKEEHTHTSACYYNDSFMDPNLWELVRSDEVTVAADGTTIMNVYYDRVEFTLTFMDGSQTVKSITEKWGAEISGEFSKDPFNTTYNGRAWECTDTNKFGYALQTLDRMPAFDATFKLYAQNDDTKKTIYYYVQKIDTTVNPNQWPTSTTDFDLLKQVDTYFNYATYDEEYHEIQGFTRYEQRVSGFTKYTSSGKYDGKNFVDDKLYLYYRRNSYSLNFYNHDRKLNDKATTVMYEDLVNKYTFEPAYPETLEPDAYIFEGWYTDQFFKNKVTDDTKMPAADVMLYAHWVPKTHKVKTWLTDKMDVPVNVGDTGKNEQTVNHGSEATEPKTPTNGNYTFVGWFYKDENGTEKAFDFSMPINRDLNLYAKWNSDVLMKYTIRYAVENADGTLTYIADDTTGSALAGTTKTFNAKTGKELNEGYQSGYFPKVSSHSLTMDIDGNEENKKNEYTFEYVKMPEVSYTVKYLEKGTEKQLADPKTVTTSAAVVTETFKQITGYAPDAYQKQLVLAAEDNEIIFWYVKDELHAPVQIIHWVQNIEGDGYTEYQSSTDLNGVIGKEYSENPLTIPGFQYNANPEHPMDGYPALASGKLTAAGLVLNLYYDRIEYPYEFRFVEKDSNPENELADPVTGMARYQAQVVEGAKSIPGYTLVSSENQAINIAIEDPADKAVKNVRIFYYTEQTVEIKYEVVGPTGCGTLDNYQDAQLKVTTGEVKGSAPTVADGFKFVGWYKDEACTEAVETGWVDASNKLTPQKTEVIGKKEDKDILAYKEATYYAKFEYNLTTLTISKTGCADIDNGQSFLFKVEGYGLPNGGLVIAINGNGSETISGLTVGQEYTVTEITEWSWRYSAGVQKKTLEPNGNTLSVENSRSNDKWLDGDCYKENNFGN